ncbi:Ig-like domain-containing protein [Acinetobacter gerneri]|uniref:Ig-like domain-containing protein n=1 Tax=Acinetobacter gerneri TaxID=202952 RepID=UPI002936C592|nr:Ig-like domain-containing protein [Acinetobacter gerneri]MDV2441751.1 Ig-like domain-containing protein [Acinetobacter gerneri]
MYQVNIISKSSHTELDSGVKAEYELKENAVVLVNCSVKELSKIEKNGNDLILYFQDGSILTIHDYYNSDNTLDNSLVFKEDDGKLLWIQHLDDIQALDQKIYYQVIDEVDPLLYHDSAMAIGLPWLIGAGVAGVAGVAAAVNSGNDSNYSTDSNKPSNVVPNVPTVTENNATGLSGTAEAGSIITVIDALGHTVTTIADSAGHWSISPNPLTDGTEGTVTATNAAGNSSAEISTGIADTIAPNTPIVTENNAAGLAGTAEAGSTVTVTDALGHTVTTTADSAGHWSITPNPIAEGTQGTVTATDAVGNVSTLVSTGTADLTAPNAPVVDENNAAGLSGTAEAGSTVTVTDASGNTVTAIADNAGQWSITPNPIAEGTQGTVTAIDAAGNMSAPVSTGLADLTAPDAPVVDENNTAGLSGTAEAGSTVTITNASGKTVTTIADSTGHWLITPNPIANGTEGTVTATDAAGNVSAPVSTGLADLTAPDAPVVDENNSAGLAGIAEAGSTVTVTDALGNTVTTTADSAGHWSITPNPIAEGTQGTVTATDTAGNVSAPVSTGLADLTAPNVPVVDENNSAGLAGTAEAGSTVTVTDASGHTVTTTADSAGHWSITPNPIADGTEGTVTATDAAGNTSTETPTGIAQKTAPDAPVVDENNSAGLAGTAEAGSTVTVTDALGNTVTAIADSAGHWSISPNPIADGTAGTVTATDAAGNESAPVSTGLADLTAPDAPVVDENNAAGLAGTAEAGSIVTVTDASGNTVTAIADSAGHWLITPNPIANGTEGTVTATDAAGNTSTETPTGIAQKTAPDAPVVDENNAAGLAGTAEAGSTVTVTDASGNTVTATANSAGNWTITPNPIAEGTQGTVTATDTAGNVSAPVSTGLADLTAPNVPVVDENNSAGLAGTAEAGSTVTVTDASGNTVTATADSTGYWSITPNPIAEGTEGTVTATDAAGNTSAPVSTGLADLTAPDAPVVDENNAAGLAGTAEAGSTVTVTDALGNTVTAIADSAGHWSITPNPIADGTEGTVTATDAAGNVSTPVSTGLADLTAPDAPVVDENNTAGLSGTAEAGSTVTITNASGKTVTTIADSTGHWSISPNPLEDGTKGIVTATDEAGNTSTPVSTGVLDQTVPDQTAPNAPVVDENNSAGLSGTAEAGSTVTVTDASGKTVTTVTDSAGHWSITPNPIAEGTQGTVTATDAAENVSTPVSTGIADLTAPNAPVVDENNSAGLSGTAEAGSTVTVTDASGKTVTTTADSAGHWSITPNPIADGTEGTVTATDAAGNVSTPVSTGLADLTAPNAPVVTENNAAGLAGTAEAGSTVTVTDASGHTVTTTADSAGHWSITPNPIADGTEGTVTATDAAGNVSAPVSTGLADLTAPNVPVVDENNSAGLTGTAEAGSTVTVTDASGNTVTAIADSAGHWSITPNPIADGTEGTVTATDAAGNVSTPVSTGVLDQTVPDQTSPNAPVVTENNATGLAGTAEAGSTVTMTDASGHTVTTTADSAGHWSITPNPIADGTEGTVTATDAAGNTSAPVSTGLADLTAPNAPVVDENNAVGLAGTAEAGSTVTVTDALGNTVTAIADSAGNWSIIPNPIADGTEGTVTATDEAGNSSDPISTGTAHTAIPAQPEQIIEYLDDVGLVTGIIAIAKPTDDSKPGFEIKALGADETATLYIDGKAVDAVYDAKTGTLTPVNDIAEGTHTVSYTITDAYGNESEPSIASNFSVDITAPEQTVVISSVHDDQLPVIGTVENGGFTNDTSPELIGTISQVLNDGDVVSIYRDGVKVGEAIVDGLNWTYIDTSGLVTGDYTYTACVEDSAGNSGEFSESYIIHELSTTPTTTIAITGYYDDVGEVQGLITTPNSTTDDRAPVLEGTINGTLAAGEQIAIVDKTTGSTLGYATVDTDTNTWSYDLSSLQNSTTYKYVAYVEDVAGNRGTVSNELDFTVSLGIYVNQLSTTDTTPIITGYVAFDIDPGEYVVVTVNGKTYSSQDGTVVVDPKNNTWYVQVPDSDALGVGTYNVTAVLKESDGSVVTSDTTTNELVVGASPAITFTSTGASTDDISTSITLSEDGTWRILSNSTVFTQNGTDSTSLGSFSSILLKGVGADIQ